jgi:multidrug efflux pump subunit AcrA (membrane-fusion protein)
MKSKFQIADSNGIEIKSGMYALVYVISDYNENVLLLPTGAVKRDNNGIYFVYKMVDGLQVRQDIKRGLCTDALVQITEGLKEGDEVYVGN